MKRRKRNNKTSTRILPITSELHDSTRLPSSGKSFRSKKNIYISAASLVLLIIAASLYIWHLSQDLPSLTKLENIDPALATHVYSEDGEIIDSFHRKNRTIAPFYKFPDHLVQALLATEDRQFFHHWGVNLKSFLRALIISALKFEKPKGTSTLTMQLARNLNLGFGLERTWKRKIQEILTSIQIERTYSKREIIEMYLNINFFGSNAYGIQSAAKTFFSKDVEQLTLEESALLIGVLKGQSLYNPLSNPDRAIVRRNIVLNAMRDVDYISQSQCDSLSQLPITLHPTSEQEKIAPYFTEYIRQQLNRLQDSLKVNVYEDGLRVYTILL